MKIAVVGCGYVGLTTAACLAKLGHDVIASDSNRERLALLTSGVPPFFEESLSEILSEVLLSRKLQFSSSNTEAVSTAKVVFICLPTNQQSDGSADMSVISRVTSEIRAHLPSGSVLAMKSTVPVGTCKKVFAQLDRSDVSYVACPEFLREGSSINDFFNADRVIIGTESDSAFAVMNEIFSPTTSRIFRTDPISAEMIKYVSNSFLAVKLSFVNSVAVLSERLGADSEAVLEGVGMDTRIGSQFLKPGPGWGGSCFPKDTAALLYVAKEVGDELEVVRSAVEFNSKHIQRIAQRIVEMTKGAGSTRQVTVLGLTFKAGTDDLRESPSIRICEHLLKRGLKVHAYDPLVKAIRKVQLPNGLVTFDHVDGAIFGSSMVVVLTEWPEFSKLDPELVGKQMEHRAIFDARNVMDIERWQESGFEIVGLR